MSRKPKANVIVKDTTPTIDPKSKFQALKTKYKLVSSQTTPRYEKQLRVIPSGILAIDMLSGHVDPINGNGGYRQFTIVEMLGLNNCYKSGTAEHAIRATQKMFGPESVLMVCSERPELERMKRFGININDMALFNAFSEDIDEQMRLAEYALEMVLDFAKLEETRLIVVDSAAAFAVYDQMYKDVKGVAKDRPLIENDAIACRAKVWNRFIPRFNTVNKGSVLFLINQKHAYIAANMFDKESAMRPTTPCGTGMDFGAALRFEVFAKPKEKLEHPVTKKKTTLSMEVTWAQPKLRDGRPTMLDSLSSVVNMGYYKDETGEQRQVWIDRGQEALLYAGYIQDLIPSDKFRKSGNNYYLNGVQYKSIAAAAEGLKQYDGLQDEIEKYLVKHSCEFFMPNRNKQAGDEENASATDETESEQPTEAADL